MIFKINVWGYSNIRFFKFKFIKNIYIFISSLDSLSIKSINVLYKDLTFESIYSKITTYTAPFVLLLFLL